MVLAGYCKKKMKEGPIIEKKFFEIKKKNNSIFIPFVTISKVVVSENYLYVNVGSGFGVQSYKVTDEVTMQEIMKYINS